MTAAMENSVVLVVEPLTSLVEDPIKRATAMNLRPTYCLTTKICAAQNSRVEQAVTLVAVTLVM